MVTEALLPAALRRSRLAVLVHFFATGAVLGVWTARLPAVKSGLHLENSQVAVVILVGALGATVTLRLAGRLIERFGSRRTTQLSGLVVMASLLLTASAVNLATLAGAMLLTLAMASFQDVGMNTQAVAIEQRAGRPIMSSFHAAFSIGGIVGAGAGALSARVHLSYRITFVVASLVLTAAIAAANWWLLNAPETAKLGKEARQGSRDLPHRRILYVLGAIGFASFLAEGAATDWSTIYLRDETGSSEAIAAVGYMMFSLTMTIGRLLGDRLAARFGPVPLMRLATAVAGIGLVGGLALRTTAAGIAGFAVLGIGLSVVVPQVFSAAGQLAPGRAAAALSVVSSVSYLGFLAGPAGIGALARSTSLRTALFIPAVLVLASTVVASRLHAVKDSPMATGVGSGGGAVAADIGDSPAR